MAQVAVERERGTLNKTLPKHPEYFFAPLILVVTVAAFLCCRSEGATWREAVPTFIGCICSSFATINGIVFADSAVHSFFLGLAIFVGYIAHGAATGKDTLWTLSISLSLSQAMFLVALTSRLPTNRIFQIFATKSVLNPIMISSICSLGLVSFLTGGAMLMAQDYGTRSAMPPPNSVRLGKFQVGPPFLLSIATFTLCGLYYRNRSNKHGNLILDTQQKGTCVVAAMAFAYAAQSAQMTWESAAVFLPILAGSAVTTLLCLIFASVADAWDAVGSGQWQMISLDTAALLGTVVTPLLVLARLACDKYGEVVSDTVGGLLKDMISLEFIRQQERPPERAMTSGLFLLLSLATMVGVPLVNMLSPIFAYMASKAYTNGQPRTKRLAVCVHLKDLLSDDNDNTKSNKTIVPSSTAIDKLAKLGKSGCKTEKKPPIVINLFVTASDLRLFPDVIVKLEAAGHSFGICSDTVVGIVEAKEEYVNVLKCSPEWYHVGPKGGTSRGPMALRMAAHHGLKVAYWSTHIGVTSREVLAKVSLPNLRSDVAATRGGSFIYLTNDWNDSDAMMNATEAIVQEYSSTVVDSSSSSNKRSDIQYSFAALSNVARDDPTLTL